MVGLVEHMMELKLKVTGITIPTDRQLFQRQIEFTDRQIDELVYELYELTSEEIKIVEDANK